MIQDLYTDNGKLLRQYKNLPDFVKNAALLSKADIEKLDDNAFAAVSERKLPIVDKGHTAISVIYFMNQKDNIENAKEIAERLIEACRRFGLTPPEDLVNFKPALPAVVEEYKPLSYADAVEISAGLHKLPPIQRRVVAVIMKQQIGKLPEELDEYTGEELNSDLKTQIDLRRMKLRNNPKAAKALEEAITIATTPEELVQFLDLIDHTFGLHKEYHPDGLQDAIKTVFSKKKSDMAAAAETITSFARSPIAKKLLKESLRASLLQDPLGTLEKLTPVEKKVVSAALNSYLESEQ